MSDILYYSNHCPHSRRILQFIQKQGLVQTLNCICVDLRYVDPQTKQLNIQTDNGKRLVLPPIIHSVPALLLVNKKCIVVWGDQIISHFQPMLEQQRDRATGGSNEPSSFTFNGAAMTNVISENYTSYDLSSSELSATGSGGRRNLGGYVGVNESIFIETPDETFKSNRLSDDAMVEQVQQKEKKREEGLPKLDASFFGGI